MRWARDVAVECLATMESVRSLLTVTTRVTVVGMDADPIVIHALTTLDVIAVTAIEILTMFVGDAAIATVTSTAIAHGAAADEAFLTPSDRIRIMTYPTSCGCGGTGRRAGLRSL